MFLIITETIPTSEFISSTIIPEILSISTPLSFVFARGFIKTNNINKTPTNSTKEIIISTCPCERFESGNLIKSKTDSEREFERLDIGKNLFRTSMSGRELDFLFFIILKRVLLLRQLAKPKPLKQRNVLIRLLFFLQTAFQY